MNENDKTIAEAMASIENRLREVYNRGFNDGMDKGRRTSRWKRIRNYLWECTTEYCGIRVNVRTPYCAYCGAKMEVDNEKPD